MKKLKVIASALAMMTVMGASAFAAYEPATATTSTVSIDASALNEYLASMNIVTNVSSTAYLDNQLILTSWNGVENAQCYQLEISRSIIDWNNVYRIHTKTAGQSFGLKITSAIKEQGVINFDDTTTYYVRVRAQVDGEYENWSIPVKVTVEEKMPEYLASLNSAIDALNNIGR